MVKTLITATATVVALDVLNSYEQKIPIIGGYVGFAELGAGILGKMFIKSQNEYVQGVVSGLIISGTRKSAITIMNMIAPKA